MITIDQRSVGQNEPCFIIAELSANHQGSLETAIATIRAAKRAGADAIKLQTYTPDTITLNSKKEYFKLGHGTIWDGKYLYELYQEAYTPWEWHKQLFEVAQEEGLICFSSPFDKTAVDFLADLDAPAYKIASFEIMDIPLIRYAASKGKPMIISTGVAELEDIELAIQTCKEAGNQDIALLKCTSSYPAPLDKANLNTIPDMATKFQTVVGLSDHTLGIIAPVVAVSLGAKIIEKHFILDKSIGGPDSSFSLDESEFRQMVDAVRGAEAALGQVNYSLSEQMKKNRKSTGRSLFIVQDVKAGDLLTEKNVRSIRPGNGIAPRYLETSLGKKFKDNFEAGTPLQEEMIQ